jgi:hypothetical protein
VSAVRRQWCRAPKFSSVAMRLKPKESASDLMIGN